MTNICKAWGYPLVCSEGRASVMYKFGVEEQMPQISFLSIDPPWVFSSRTGKIRTFKRLHFYICFMPYVLLKINLPAKTKNCAFAPEQKKWHRQACWAVFQVGYYFVRERHLAASQSSATGTSLCQTACFTSAFVHLREEREKRILKAELATKTKTMKKTSRGATRGSWHSWLLWEAQKAFIFAPSRSSSWTLDLFPAISIL